MRRLQAGSPSDFLLAATALYFLLTSLGSASAQASLQMSPPNAQYASTPGDVINGSFSVTNTAGSPVTLRVLRSDFVLNQAGGIVPLSSGALPTSIGTWLTTGQASVTIQPNKTQTVRYTIHVPQHVAAGTHWGLILLRLQAPKASSNGPHVVGMTYVAQLAYVVYVNVGSVVHAGRIASIALAAGSSGVPQVDITFQNTGSAVSNLSGKLELRDLDGKLVKTVPVKVTTVLPGGVAKIGLTLDKSIKAGKYLATAVLHDGSPDLVAGQAEIVITGGP